MSETRDVCNRCGGTGAFLAAPLPISGIRLWEPCPTCSEEGEISRLQSRIEELERALKPFARIGEQCGNLIPDNATPKLSVITYGDLRQARSVLDAHKEGGN